MAKTRMGFEGQMFEGAAGATATGAVVNARDISYDFDYEAGSTTPRGEGITIPIECESVSSRKVSITFNHINKDSDTVLAAMLAAAYAGTPVALRLKDKVAGKGYDGDVVLKVKQSKPLKGEQTLDFTAMPNDDLRAPQLYV